MKRPHLVVSGASRGAIKGSFYIAAWMRDPVHGVKHLIGAEAVLSRWHVSGCKNCQNHLDVRAHIPLPVGWTEEDVENAGVYVRLHTRETPGGTEKTSGAKLNFEVRGVLGDS